MGRMQKQKGKRGEQEAAALLQGVITPTYRALDLAPPVVKRNYDQSAEGGCDLRSVPFYAVEVKRVSKRLCLPAWWRQTVEQAEDIKREPCLMYRRNYDEWRVLVHRVAVEDISDRPEPITWLEFSLWYEERLLNHLRTNRGT